MVRRSVKRNEQIRDQEQPREQSFQQLGVSIFRSTFWIVGGLVMSMALYQTQAYGELVFQEDSKDSSTSAGSQELKESAPSQNSGAELKDPLEGEPIGSERAKSPSKAPLGSEAGSEDVEDLSRSELLRRERLRQEVQNDDLLQERLEELRLKDETRRTKQLIKQAQLDGEEDSSDDKSQEKNKSKQEAKLRDEVVGTMAKNQNQKKSKQGQKVAQASPAQQAGAQVTATSESEDEMEDISFRFQPQFGLSNFTGDSTGQFKGRYSGGLSLGIGVTENLSFEMGYNYGQYGVSQQSFNPYLQSQIQSGYVQPTSNELLQIDQHVFDAGLKFHLLNESTRFRPFIGGGLGYSSSLVNYDSNILSQMNQSGAEYLDWNYKVSSFLGYLSTGFDVVITDTVSVGAVAKYYTTLSSRQSRSLPRSVRQSSVYGGSYAGYGGYYQANAASSSSGQYDKQSVGSSIADAALYSIKAGISFSF